MCSDVGDVRLDGGLLPLRAEAGRIHHGPDVVAEEGLERRVGHGTVQLRVQQRRWHHRGTQVHPRRRLSGRRRVRARGRPIRVVRVRWQEASIVPRIRQEVQAR